MIVVRWSVALVLLHRHATIRVIDLSGAKTNPLSNSPPLTDSTHRRTNGQACECEWGCDKPSQVSKSSRSNASLTFHQSI